MGDAVHQTAKRAVEHLARRYVFWRVGDVGGEVSWDGVDLGVEGGEGGDCGVMRDWSRRCEGAPRLARVASAGVVQGALGSAIEVGGGCVVDRRGGLRVLFVVG